jgi:hypothetical protein
VTPLFKSENPKLINNYRPISVLPALSKIYEKAIKVRLLKHLSENKLIHPSQYGFLKSSNTTTAASCLVNGIVSGINNKCKTACIFVDVKKAFDCLDFEILVRKLETIGIKGKALKLLKNYLQNRKQIVVVNGTKGESRDVVSGAAQGSVLGPLLFLIYINDLLYLKLNSVGRLFADDAAFLYQATDYRSLHSKMQNDLITVESYLASINLELSVNKTKFMIFKTKNSTNSDLFDRITFNNHTIDIVESFKYLGLIIDSEIDWKYHVDSVASKISPYIGMLYRIRPFIEEKTAMQIYYAYIHSRLSYCLPVWSSCSLDLKMRLQRLQNKAMKAIRMKPFRTPTVELYDNRLVSFLQLCDYEAILFIHKVKFGLVKCDVTFITYENISGRQTRQSNLLRPPNFLMAKSQDSLFYRGICLYNDFTLSVLSKDVKSLSNLKARGG